MRGCVAAAFVILALAPSARAAPRDPVAADRLFRQGQELMGSGDYAAACPKLADSYGLDPTLGTLLNLAFCHEKQGRLFTALTEYRAVESGALKSEQGERASFARGRCRDLEARLPRARLALPAGVRVGRVLVDDQPIEANVGKDFAVPPGPHVVTVELASGERRSEEATFPETAGATTTVHFADAAPASRTPRAAPESPRAEPEPPREEHGSGRRWLGFGIAGAGVLALGAGTYFGIATFGKKDDASARCDDRGCDEQGLADGDQAHTYATLSTIFVPVGLVAAGVGLYLALTAPRAGAPRASARVAVSPRGLLLTGSF